jgi:DNA-binding response OmpR family regulator
VASVSGEASLGGASAELEAGLEVIAVAAHRDVVDRRLVESLRREGIAVTERVNERPEAAGQPSAAATERSAAATERSAATAASEPSAAAGEPSAASGDEREPSSEEPAGDDRDDLSAPVDEPWPSPAQLAAGSGASLYLWFPGQTAGGRAGDRAIERLASWLEAQPSPPAILAVAAPDDVEALLAAGVDDVVPRTISERELVARIRALHRRMTRRPREGQLRFGALTIDTVERAAWMDGAIVSITPIEQAVLVTLIRARGRALSRGALLEAAWSDGDFEISERAVDNVILRLRRKLPRPEVIETVRGVGFRLAGGGRELAS